MLKKVLYHGGFATLGVALLLGMGVLQANGRKTSDNLMGSSEAEVSAPTDENAPTDVAAAEPVNDAIPAPSADAKPIQVASLPQQPMPAPEIKSTPATSSILDDATQLSVFDTAHKSATKKTFKMNTASLKHAKSYYQKLAHRAHKRAVIKAEVNKAWVSVSSKDLDTYLKNAN